MSEKIYYNDIKNAPYDKLINEHQIDPSNLLTKTISVYTPEGHILDTISNDQAKLLVRTTGRYIIATTEDIMLLNQNDTVRIIDGKGGYRDMWVSEDGMVPLQNNHNNKG